MAPTPPPVPPEAPKGCTGWVIGMAAIIGIAVVGVLSSNSGTSTTSALSAAADSASLATTPALAIYADPSKAAVQRALAEERDIFAAGGLSGLARRSKECFDQLAQSPNFGALDFCLAFDAYATGQAEDEMAPSSILFDSYFVGTGQRAADAADKVVGTQSDPSARIADIRALAIRVVDEGLPAETGSGDAPSFSCASVTSENLKLICAVPLLAHDDQELSAAYKAALARSSDAKRIQDDEAAWIARRNNALNDVVTIHGMYMERISVLSSS